MNVIVKKFGEIFLIFLASATVIFFLSRLTPSDPVEIMLGENATNEDRIALKRELGIDKPILVQYKSFILKAVQLDFGKSIVTNRFVSDEVKDAFPETLKIALISILISLFISVLMGIYSAYYEKKFLDKFFFILTSLMIVSPSFLLGPILLLLFAVKFPVFPVSESHLLAGFTLSIPFSAYSSRVLRASLLEERRKGYFIHSIEKGNSKIKSFFVHLFPNSLPPFIQINGLQFGGLLTGAIIAEKIFRVQGIGSLLVKSVYTRDYPLLTGLVIIFSAIYLLSNLFADVITKFIDPRVKYEK
jgi:peptide/nickel transport system permease protein